MFGSDGAAFVRQHNSELRASVAALNGDRGRAAVVDVNSLFADIGRRPGLYGLRVTDSPCLTDAVTNVCGGFDSMESASRLYWDGVHLSSAGHNVVYQFVKATERAAFDGPRHANAIGDSVDFTTTRHGEFIETQVARAQQVGDPKFSLSLGVDRAKAQRNGTLSSLGSTTAADTFGIIALAPIGSGARIGATISHSSGSTRLEGGLGQAQIRTTGFSLFGLARVEQFDIMARGTFAQLNINNIQRATDFSFSPLATSATKGKSFELGLDIQRRWTIARSFGVTPFASLNWHRWDAKARKENEAGVAGIAVGRSVRSELALKAGLSFDGSFKLAGLDVRPSLRVAYHGNVTQRGGSPTVTLVSGQQFQLPIQAGDKDAIEIAQRLDVGLSDKIRLIFEYRREFEGPYRKNQSLNAGLSFNF